MPLPQEIQERRRRAHVDYASFWNITNPEILQYRNGGLYVYTGETASETGLGTPVQIRTVEPMDVSEPLSMTQFEVTIQDVGVSNTITIGVCDRLYPPNFLPGWAAKTGRAIGVDAAEGLLYNNEDDGVPKYTRCSVGDVMKCVLLPAVNKDEVTIEFYCNNVKLTYLTAAVPKGGFYGVVGLASTNEALVLGPPQREEMETFESLFELKNHYISYIGDGVCQYNAPRSTSYYSSSNPNEGPPLYIGTLRSSKPVEIGNSLQVVLLDKGEECAIAVGVSSFDYPDDSMPGWREESMAYHADISSILNGNEEKDPVADWAVGDTLQCSVEPIDGSTKEVRVVFRKNSDIIGKNKMWSPSGGLHWAVGMMSKGERIQIVLPRKTIPLDFPLLRFEDTWQLPLPNVEYTQNGICVYMGKEGDLGIIRSREPINPMSPHPFFEVKIINPGRLCQIALGVCSERYPLTAMPGWIPKSIGFHCNTGNVYHSSEFPEHTDHPCTQGDVVRCAVAPIDGSSKQVNVSFYRNGALASTAMEWTPTGGFYAHIGMMSANEKIQIACPLMRPSTLKTGIDGYDRELTELIFVKPSVVRTAPVKLLKTKPPKPSKDAPNSPAGYSYTPPVASPLDLQPTSLPLKLSTGDDETDGRYSKVLPYAPPVSPSSLLTKTTPRKVLFPNHSQDEPINPPAITRGRNFSEPLITPISALPPITPLPPVVEVEEATVPEIDRSASHEFICLHHVVYNTKDNILEVKDFDGSKFAYAKYRRPLMEKMNYFEVDLLTTNNIAVGVSSTTLLANKLLGTYPETVSFDTSSGQLHFGKPGPIDSGVTFQQGDTVGCKVSSVLSETTNKNLFTSSQVKVEFYKNSTEIASVQVSLSIGLLCPTVCFADSNSSVKFVYNYKMVPQDYFEHHSIPKGYMNFPQPDPWVPPSGWKSIGQCDIKQEGPGTAIVSSADASAKEEPILLQHYLPFSKCDNYFQAELTNSSSNYSILCIGAMHRIQEDEVEIPGHMEGSVGFQVSTGLIMKSNEMVSNISYQLIDRISWSVDGFKIGIGMEISSTSSQYFFVTIDNQEVAKVLCNVTSDPVYPTLALLPMKHSLPSIDNTLCKLTFPSSWPSCISPLWGIARVSDGFKAKDNGSVFINDGSSAIRSFQACFPLSTAHPYYEITILRGGSVSLGLSSLQSSLSLDVGMEKHSIGYHIRSGYVLYDGNLVSSTPVHPHEDIKIGCGALFPQDGSYDSAEVFFTVNGTLVSKNLVFVPMSGLFPTVCTSASIILFNLSHPHPFPDMIYSSQWNVLENILPSRHSIQAVSHAHIGLAQSSGVASASYPIYCKVSLPSKGSGKTLFGFSNCKESPFTPKVSRTNRSFFLEISSGTVISIQNGTRHSDECHIPKGATEVGCGVQPLHNSHSSLVFFTADDQIIYILTSNLLNINIHPTIFMVGTMTKLEVNTCAVWPPVSPVGFGWGRFYNVKYVDGTLTQSGADIGFIQSSSPLIPSHSYFEVAILAVDPKKTVALGLASRRYNQNQWIGWKSDSIGYHSDDGKMYKSSGVGSDFGPRFSEGDIVGCGVIFPANFETTSAIKGENRLWVYFTLNGRQIAKPEPMTVPEGGLFPTVCLESSSESVTVSLQKPKIHRSRSLWSRKYCVNQAGQILQHSFKIRSSPHPIAYCQGTEPVSDTSKYFEVEILNCEEKSNTSVGIASLQPVGSPKIDTGFILFNLSGQIIVSPGDKKAINTRHRCDVGDTIGCLAIFKPPSVEFYHNNIKVMYTPIPEQLLRSPLYPTIVLTNPNDTFIPMLHALPPTRAPQSHIGWLRSERVKLKGSVIEYNGPGGSYVGTVGVAQMNQPLNQQYSYYEITILSLGESSTIAIGAAALDYPLTHQPGWVAGSIGYHGDDGRLFNVSGTGCCFGPTWKKYDTVGLGVRLYQTVLPNSEMQVFFTYNGHELGHSTAQVPPSGLFPTVGLHSKGERVKINHNAKQSNVIAKLALKWRTLIGAKVEYSVLKESYILTFSNIKRRVPITLEGLTTGLGLAVSYEPFSEKLVYFEVEILKLGKIRAIAIGAAKKDYSVDSVPGWLEGSVAYHTDTGSIHIASGKGKLFGPVAAEGDVIGCGVTLANSDSRHCMVFFTRNGIPIGGRVQVAVPNDGFYPTVGLVSSGDRVSVKFMDTFKPSPKHSKFPVGLMRIQNTSYSDHVLSYLGGSSKGAANAQFAVALNTDHNYYSANIIQCEDLIKIGLAPRDYLLSHAPGVSSYSVAYDATEGKIRGVFGHEVNVAAAPMCSVGDTIGCGISLVEGDPSNDGTKKKSSYFVFFTRNNVFVHQMELIDLHDDLFPIVGFIPKGNKSAVYMDWTVSAFEPPNVL